MKRIHPELTATTVRCSSCGETFVLRSDRSELLVEVCSKCHPAYTGTQRTVAGGDRIARFEERLASARRR
jgi:large subunit ribosomal protein L31